MTRDNPAAPGSAPLEPAALRRRAMLTGLAAAVPAAAALAQAAAPETPTPTPPPTRLACQFFNADELRAVTALVGRIIPADELGPGAVEADVPVFLDRQLAGAYGSGAHFYRAGPHQPGTPQQGYQLAFTPAELVREGLARLDAAARQRHGAAFADSTPEQQDAMMTVMHDGKFDMGPVPSDLFFNALSDLTMEGFFSDPLYGGNKDMAGWKLVGFLGSYASYAQEIERYNLEWRRPPVPIEADLDLALQPGLPGALCVTR